MSMPNSEYWKQRFTQLEEARNKKANETFADIAVAYRRAEKQLEAEVDRWYRRFMNGNGIVDMADAKKLLTKGELQEFKWDVREYLKYAQDNMVSGQWEKQLENASARYHISRLEALRINSAAVIEELFNKEEQALKINLSDAYQDDYYKTIYEVQKGYDTYFNVAKLDPKEVEKIISKPWAPDKYNFSERIWNDKNKLINNVHKELMTCLLTGESPQKAIGRLQKAMGTARYNAKRLVLTETAATASYATQDSYRDLDVEKYEIVATLDSRTSEICQSLDGKTFEMKDYQAGVTAPPFHCFCRSTTVPAFGKDYDIKGSRAARDADGKTYYVDADMKYPEWKAKYVDKTEPMPKSAENNAKTVDKSGKSGIIKSKDTNTQNNLLGKKESLWSKIKSKLASSDNVKIAETDAEAALLDIGFKRVEKTFYSKVDPDMQVRVIDQLTKLEDKFGVIKKSIDPFVTADASGGSVAFTRCTLDTPARQSLHFSKTKYKNAKTHIRDMKHEIATGYCMPCDVDDDTISKYVVTHEYGHMLSNVLAHERMQGTIYTHRSLIESYKTQITDIAKTLDENYSEDKYLSQYGKTNDNEFFAECFANSQLGSPNILGKAMNIWLERRGF